MELLFNEKHKMYYREGTLDVFVMNEIDSSYKHLDLQPNDIVFDVGGNIGAFAKWASPQCKQVYSFEPDPDNFEVLTKNIEGLHNVCPQKLALIETEEKTIDFYQNKGKNKGMHSTVKIRGRDIVTVQAANFYRELLAGEPTKVKIDIEGGEYGILMDYVFPDFVKALAIELHLGKRQWRQDLTPKLINSLTNQFTNILVKPKITEGNWATVGVFSR